MSAAALRADRGRHLLVVDDDDRIRELLKEYLARAGFRVTTAGDAAAARRLMGMLDFDLLVVDVMMPGEDGLSLTGWVRKGGATPVLILTARGLAGDRIAGLSAGADDYLSKPFEPQELLLRIEAILRRAGRADGPRRISLGAHAFDLERGELLLAGSPVRLTEGEAKLLKRLAAAPHTPVDRLDLALDAGDSAEASGRAVDVQVTRLRRKLEADPRNPRYLQTVRGVGYMLAPD
jgi:two-component system phosphate regulon response regulator OmpR